MFSFLRKAKVPQMKCSLRCTKRHNGFIRIRKWKSLKVGLNNTLISIMHQALALNGYIPRSKQYIGSVLFHYVKFRFGRRKLVCELFVPSEASHCSFFEKKYFLLVSRNLLFSVEIEQFPGVMLYIRK